jgi:hypothetical protein
MTSPATLPGFCGEGVFYNNKHIPMESAGTLPDLQARIVHLEEENAALRCDSERRRLRARRSIPAPAKYGKRAAPGLSAQQHDRPKAAIRVTENIEDA